MAGFTARRVLGALDRAGLAQALRLARDGTEDEPVQAATAWSFLALGAA